MDKLIALVNFPKENAICPLCKYETDLQIQDYVDRPMIWCDNCGATIVLDITLEKALGIRKNKFNEVECMFIKKVIPNNLTKDKDKVEDQDWSIALPCDSFNVEKPKIMYPVGTDLSHGGVYIYLECQGKEGLIKIRYWGD